MDGSFAVGALAGRGQVRCSAGLSCTQRLGSGVENMPGELEMAVVRPDEAVVCRLEHDGRKLQEGRLIYIQVCPRCPRCPVCRCRITRWLHSPLGHLWPRRAPDIKPYTQPSLCRLLQALTLSNAPQRFSRCHRDHAILRAAALVFFVSMTHPLQEWDGHPSPFTRCSSTPVAPVHSLLPLAPYRVV